MSEQVNIHYKKSTTIFNLLFVGMVVAVCILLTINHVILGLVLTLLFIFHITLFITNFIGLVRRNPPLIISKEGITYTTYNIFISTEQINSISYTCNKKDYIDINLKESISKYSLPKTVFGKIMISGGGLNFSSKTNIKILLHGLDINAKEFKKILIDQKLNKINQRVNTK
ncbi:hypothetical protein [Flavobacterium psychrotrophum]|uniref:hypothetical protein n=1 Tax=Flavobacterium psychrotrophum TaxID=2294119 RepID=UPI000E30E599|nr:hypothetical protein [Flavobacterium psychrotrophum]